MAAAPLVVREVLRAQRDRVDRENVLYWTTTEITLDCWPLRAHARRFYILADTFTLLPFFVVVVVLHALLCFSFTGEGSTLSDSVCLCVCQWGGHGPNDGARCLF